MFQKALDDEFEFIINNCGHWEDKRKYKNDPKWKKNEFEICCGDAI